MLRLASAFVVAGLVILSSSAFAQYDPVPGPSPYGPQDQAGASNTQGPAKVKEAKKLIKQGVVLQLGHVYEEGMPQFPGTHPWLLSLKPPEAVADQVSVGEVLDGPIEIGQLGTQFDALGHFGYLPPGSEGFGEVLFYNEQTGDDLLPPEEPNRGLARLGVEEPLFRGDWDGLRRLRDATGIRIAGGDVVNDLVERYRHRLEVHVVATEEVGEVELRRRAGDGTRRRGRGRAGLSWGRPGSGRSITRRTATQRA